MVQGRFLALFLGDSVAWGQGLLEEDKFSTWVIQWLNEYHPNLRAYKSVKAHSGAIIGAAGDPTPNPGWPGEVPNSYPTIHQQIATYADSDPQDVDLIVIAGGINDVDVRTIFNPRTAPDALRSRIRDVCGAQMSTALTALAAKFPNPATRILVLGYYPILSAQSHPAGVVPLMTALGAPLNGGSNPWSTIVDNAALFEAESDAQLQASVAAANAAHPGRHFVWVKPVIRAENSAFAPQPWIFGVSIPAIGAEDEVASVRRQQCQIQTDLEKRVLCYRASAGHPNRWGARAYFNAIYPVLQREYGY